MGNFHVLYQKENDEYIWDYHAAKQVLKEFITMKKASGQPISQNKVYEELAKICYVTPDAVRKWFKGDNGPADQDRTVSIADYLETDIMNLLIKKTQEDDTEMIDTIKDMPSSSIFFNTGVDLQTLKFISMLNTLAEKTTYGFTGFSKLNYTPDEDYHKHGIIYIDDDSTSFGKIIMDMCVDEHHHDVISTYDTYVNGMDYDVRVVSDERSSEEPIYWIDVTDTSGLSIVIEDGRWYWS